MASTSEGLLGLEAARRIQTYSFYGQVVRKARAIKHERLQGKQPTVTSFQYHGFKEVSLYYFKYNKAIELLLL